MFYHMIISKWPITKLPGPQPIQLGLYKLVPLKKLVALIIILETKSKRREQKFVANKSALMDTQKPSVCSVLIPMESF